MRCRVLRHCRRDDRRVLRVDELTEYEIALIAQAEAPAEADQFNHEDPDYCEQADSPVET